MRDKYHRLLLQFQRKYKLKGRGKELANKLPMTPNLPSDSTIIVVKKLLFQNEK